MAWRRLGTQPLSEPMMVSLLTNVHMYASHGLIEVQYIPRNMHTVFALLCFVVVIHWLIFPYPSGLLHWHCGNLTIAPVPAKQPWWIWINTSCEFIMNDCITTTKQSTTKPCAYFLGYTVWLYGTDDNHLINTLRPEHKGWCSVENILKSIFLDENRCILIQIPLKIVSCDPTDTRHTSNINVRFNG